MLHKLSGQTMQKCRSSLKLLMFYKILHQLVDILPHGVLGKHLVFPAGMTVVTSKYQQELKPMQTPFFLQLLNY